MKELTPYDDTLEQSFGNVPEVDSLFENTLEGGAPASKGDRSVDALFNNLPGDEDADMAAIAGSAKKASPIFEAALKAHAKKENEGIPAYARVYLKKQMKLQEADDEFTDEGAASDGTEDVGNDSMSFNDLGLGGGDSDSGDMGDMEDGDEFGGDFGDEDVDQTEEETFDFENSADEAQTEEWQDEEIEDEELASIMGTSPESKNMGFGQGQHRLRPFNATGIRSTSAFSNTANPSNTFDNDLNQALSFTSGGFLETFDDGLLFVDRKGQSLALVIPDVREDDFGRELSPTESMGVLLIKGTDEDDQEMVFEISGEELNGLISALTEYKTQTKASFAGVYEKAQKYKNKLRKK